MTGFYDYKKHAILYVDDEEKSLKYFAMAFEPHFRILTASSAQEALAILERQGGEIGLLLTDQRMPGQKGVQLLERARQMRPRVLRFLVTAYSDVEAAIDAVNTGAIYKYISKPWDIPDLEMTLRRAMEFFIVQQERDKLLREKLSVLHNVVIADRVLALGVLASGMSHHIRNSLVAIQTFLELAPAMMEQENIDLQALRNPNFWGEFYQQACEQVKRIARLLGTLTLASEPAPPAFADRVRPGEIVLQAVEAARKRSEGRKVDIQVSMPDDLPEMVVDLTKFRRFFELLLLDELITLPEGSQVNISAQALPGEQVVRFQLTDNGPGVPESSLRAVFDPFFIRLDDPKEFGLNLMACYFLVHHHGGRIKVVSRPEGGTLFDVCLPLDAAEALPTMDERIFIKSIDE